MKTNRLMLTTMALILITALTPFNATAQDKDKDKGKTQHEDTHLQINGREGTTHLVRRSSEDDVETDFNIKGVEFNEDYTDVVSISVGGYLDLRETRRGIRRKLSIESDASGRLVRTFAVQGETRPFEPEGRAWLTTVLRDMVESGFDAKQRVARIYKQRGAEGVLNAARTLKGSYARSTYLKLLLAQEKPSDETVARILSFAAREQFSDYERATLLNALVREHLSGSRGRKEFFEAVSRLQSDYERSRVLLPVVRRIDLADEWTIEAVKAVSAGSSDYEKARVLLAAVTGARPRSETVRAAVIEAATRLTSDYERNRVIKAVMQTKTGATSVL
ncbi:MAG TPA: hypothetical protein VGV59_07720 [Pyrinomonadaceae bacterium]|nr:hypothetical protein [Pyrinomonadaceae bacterium]